MRAEYRFTGHIALFANARDLRGIYNNFECCGPSMPKQAWLLLRQDIGTLVNIGLKAQFCRGHRRIGSAADEPPPEPGRSLTGRPRPALPAD